MKNVKWTILIAVAVLVLILPCVNAGFVENQKETLRGIKGMFVSIEPPSDNVKEFGLTEDVLQTDVELKLRLAGMKVLSKEEWFKTLGSPYLYLNINTVTHPSDVIFAYNIFLHLVQVVDLQTQKDTMTPATTWRKLCTGYVGKDKLKDTLRSTTKNLA